MLTKFTVTNFKNFRQPATFDLTKSKKYEFNSECVLDGVVRKALVYGHNGVGKSNLGFAIFDLVSHLTDKLSANESYNNYINAYNDSKVAEFIYELSLTEGTLIYKYGKSDPESLVYEKISINGNDFASIDRRENTVASFFAKGTESLQKDIGESKISILSYIKKNTVLDDNRDNRCFFEFIKFVNSMLFFRSLEKNNYIGFQQGSRDIAADIIERNNIADFQSFLNKAGIECKLNIIDDGHSPSLAFDFDGKLVSFFEIASQGTRSLALFYYWFQRLRDKNTEVLFLFVDEFDAFYHHGLSALIVKELRGIKAQVIITTHNISIMTNELLRPDCYFLMNKKDICSLAGSTVKELREAHNIEKMYKAGTFNG
ncbi:MAG: AAA family ATPase [Thiotrichaceae bacterium]|nr:AAA family ATPase [Thiotrichaceae bacterium]